MFAPLISKPKTRIAGFSKGTSALQCATPSRHRHKAMAMAIRRIEFGHWRQGGPGLLSSKSPSIAWDFSKISLYPPEGMGGLATLPTPAPRLPVRGTGMNADIPSADGSADMDYQPKAGTWTSGPSPVPTADSTDACAEPTDMQKITSGGFLGGLSMDDYYPDLAGEGHYEHPATAGTFDTGTRAGANIQLIGVVLAPCRPDQYSLAQTVTVTRSRRNGTVRPEEGTTFDDIGRSGRDASRAPFRQDFLGGTVPARGAPFGYIISMADSPNSAYGPTDTIERDNTFTSSLVGPGGRKSVSWSLSMRITNGAVTKNDFG